VHCSRQQCMCMQCVASAPLFAPAKSPGSLCLHHAPFAHERVRVCEARRGSPEHNPPQSPRQRPRRMPPSPTAPRHSTKAMALKENFYRGLIGVPQAPQCFFWIQIRPTNRRALGTHCTPRSRGRPPGSPSCSLRHQRGSQGQRRPGCRLGPHHGAGHAQAGGGPPGTRGPARGAESACAWLRWPCDDARLWRFCASEIGAIEFN
jgi:hypothetical protein